MTGNRMRAAIAIGGSPPGRRSRAARSPRTRGHDRRLRVQPPTITIDVGDSVTWTNNDDVDHTATGSGFDTSTITSGGGTAKVTFDTAGTFAYACTSTRR